MGLRAHAPISRIARGIRTIKSVWVFAGGRPDLRAQSAVQNQGPPLHKAKGGGGAAACVFV
eukprot:scaffold2455_cov387-Prasinococcus_capsulatus_cf.AAC.13